MSSDRRPVGPFTVWTDNGYEGWSYKDFPTLKEAIDTPKHYSTWVITRPVRYTVTITPLPDDDEELWAGAGPTKEQP